MLHNTINPWMCVDDMIIAENQDKILGEFLFNSQGKFLNDHEKGTFISRALQISRNRMGDQGVKRLPKLGKTATYTLYDSLEKPCLIKIILIEKIPATGQIGVSAKISKKCRFAIAGGAMN